MWSDHASPSTLVFQNFEYAIIFCHFVLQKEKLVLQIQNVVPLFWPSYRPFCPQFSVCKKTMVSLHTNDDREISFWCGQDMPAPQPLYFEIFSTLYLIGVLKITYVILCFYFYRPVSLSFWAQFSVCKKTILSFHTNYDIEISFWWGQDVPASLSSFFES